MDVGRRGDINNYSSYSEDKTTTLITMKTSCNIVDIISTCTGFNILALDKYVKTEADTREKLTSKQLSQWYLLQQCDRKSKQT